MKKTITQIELTNRAVEKLRIYKVDGCENEFAIGTGDCADEDFTFSSSEFEDLLEALKEIRGGK